MQTLLFVILAAGAGAGAWWITTNLEKTKYTGRVRELESKIRLAQGEAFQLKEQMSLLKGEVIGLQKTLCEERVTKQNQIMAMSESFKRGILFAGMSAMVLGMTFGGTVSWLSATWRAEAKQLRESSQFDLNYRLAALKAELLEKQMIRMEKELDRFRGAWERERASKTVAETKLEILMHSLSAQKGVEGFNLSYPKLKDSLKQKIEHPVTKEDFPFLKQAALQS